jgi:hypothetical protein
MDSLFGGIDMPAMVVALGRLPAIESHVADTAHHRAKDFRGQFLAAGPYCREFRTPFSVVPIFLKGVLRYRRQERAPICLETGAGSFECRPGTIPMLARLKPGIESARPMPLVDVDRDAGALPDRANTDIAIEDVPSDLVRIVGTASGEPGYPP